MSSDKKSSRNRAPATKAVHSGRAPHDNFGFVNPPVYRGSTVLFPTVEKLWKRDQAYTYGRSGTPTITALEEALAEIEGGAATALTGSGYQAVSTAIVAFVKAGDHILMLDSVYQPTRKFCDHMLARLGVETTYYDPLIGAGIAELVRPNTRLIFTESPGSQTFEVQDIPAIARVAAERDLWLLMDNTWATPLYFRPFDHGVDVSIHAATKYPAGHSDVLLGTVSANAACWERLHEGFLTLGACAAPDDVYQVLRGLRTMGVRLERHEQSTLEIARWLEQQPGVACVLHPGLESHPGHALWKRDFTGSSGIFSVVLDGGGQKQAHAFLDALEIFGLGYSWGGYESLAVHVYLGDRTIAKGPYEGPLIRLQIGLEDVADIKADITRGLKAASAVQVTA